MTSRQPFIGVYTSVIAHHGPACRCHKICQRTPFQTGFRVLPYKVSACWCLALLFLFCSTHLFQPDPRGPCAEPRSAVTNAGTRLPRIPSPNRRQKNTCLTSSCIRPMEMQIWIVGFFCFRWNMLSIYSDGNLGHNAGALQNQSRMVHDIAK